MNGPKISIIVPAYNAEKHIRRCIDAIIAQTCADWEALIVDNNSTDNTAGIIKEYAAKDPRIKYYFFREVQGPGPARNVGLDNARGEFIMFADTDDWYAPTMCEEMLRAIVRANTDMAMCETDLIKAPDIPNIEVEFPIHLDGKTEVSGFVDFIAHPHLAAFINPPLWNKIFRKSIVDKYNIRLHNLKTNEDRLFAYMYFCATNTAFLLKRRLYTYDKTDENSQVLRHRATLVFDFIKVAEVLYDWMKTNDMYDERGKAFYSHMLYLLDFFTKMDMMSGLNKESRRVARLLSDLMKRFKKGDLSDGVVPKMLFMPAREIERRLEYYALAPLRPAFAKKNVPVAMTRGPDTRATIRSIIDNSSAEGNYDIVVFHDESDAAAKAEIEKIERPKNFSIRTYPVPPFAENPILENMPDYERVVSVEGGSRFDGDVAELYGDFLAGEGAYSNEALGVHDG